MINEKSSFDSILFKKNSGNGIEPPIFDDDIIHRYNHFLVFLVFFFGSKFHDFVLIFFFYLFSYLCHSAPQVVFIPVWSKGLFLLPLPFQAKIPPNIIQYPFKGKASCRFWHFNCTSLFNNLHKTFIIYIFRSADCDVSDIKWWLILFYWIQLLSPQQSPSVGLHRICQAGRWGWYFKLISQIRTK